MKKVAILIDGGHVGAIAKKKAGRHFDADFVERLAMTCAIATEEIQRILYYDCDPYIGKVKMPVSGLMRDFAASNQLTRELARKDLIAVRRGVLKFRGWVPRTIPIAGGTPLSDADFKPSFEQKGVDMRIGLDMANYAANRAVELIALCSNDTDCVPAMKYARRAGLQVALICIPHCLPTPELVAHCDFVRKVPWP
jgi:uncharacterized LabA/DUF88 family protein